MATETQTTTTTATAPPVPVLGGDAPPPAKTETPPAKTGGDGATTKAPDAPTSPLGGTTEDKGKPEGDGAKAPTAEELQLKFPEGFKEDTALMGQFKPLLKDLGLKSEGAQKLVDLYVKSLSSMDEQRTAAVNEQVKKWVEANKTDKEIGGADYAKNIAGANRVIDKFGDAEVKAFFQLPGVGNHPAVQRLMVKIGKAFAEDSVSTVGAGHPVKPGSEEQRLQVMYPTHFQNPKQ